MTRYKVIHVGYVEADCITDVPNLMANGKKINFIEMHIINDEIEE